MGIHIYSVHRKEEDFADANLFRPERWMEGASEEQSHNNSKAANPFSLGPKACIGKRYVSLSNLRLTMLKTLMRSLAYAEMRLIVTHFLWNFDMLPIDDLTWMDRCKSYTVWEKPPLMVKFKQRAVTPA